MEKATRIDKPSATADQETHVNLAQFQPGAIEDGKLDGLISYFFGPHAKWYGAYTQGSQIIKAREKLKRERYLAAHPDIASGEYNRERKKRLELLKTKAKTRINRRFQDAVSKRFGTAKPDRFAELAYVNAANTMNKVAEIVFPDSGAISILNETNQQPISAASLVRDAVRPDFVPSLRQEIVQRALLAHVAAELASRDSHMKGRLKLAKIQSFLGEKLFEGKKGTTETISISGVFDNSTNEPILVEGPETGKIYTTDAQKDQHIKDITLTVRKIAGSRIRVHTSHNVKSPESAIIKAIRQAQRLSKTEEGKRIEPLSDVHDTHRILFAVVGGNKEVDFVYTKIKALFSDPKNQKHFADLDESDKPIMGPDGNLKGGISILQDRNLQKNSAAKSPHVNFKRILVNFDGLTVPIEIKIQGMKDFLRDEFHVGNIQENGSYDGAAHDLYDIKRAVEVLPYFIPSSSMPAEIDINEELRKTYEGVIAKLRNSTRKVKKS